MSTNHPKPRKVRHPKKQPQPAQLPDPPPGPSLEIDSQGLTGPPDRIIDEADLVGRKVAMRLPRVIDVESLNAAALIPAAQQALAAIQRHLDSDFDEGRGTDYLHDAANAWDAFVEAVGNFGVLDSTVTFRGDRHGPAWRLWKELRNVIYRRLEEGQDFGSSDSDVLAKLLRKLSANSSAHPSQVTPRIPRWDCTRRVLWLGHLLLKQFNKHPAGSQTAILDAFQSQCWEGAVEYPDKLNHNEARKAYNRLTDGLLKAAKEAHLPFTIKFFGDGTSDAICWEVVPVQVA